MSERWIKAWRIPEDHWLHSDLRYIGAWMDLIYMAEYKDGKAVIRGQMIKTKRGCIYTSIHELADKWGVSRKWVRAFIDMLIQDEMVTELQRDHRGYHLKVNNYAKYQDKPNHRGTTEVTTEDTTEVTTEVTTEASFFLTNNIEGIDVLEGERRTQHFVPPTQSDVLKYISDQHYALDGRRFYEYYEARGWKGIRNWQAAVRSWVARDGTKPQAKKFDNFEPRPSTGSSMDEYLKLLEVQNGA